MKVNNRKCVRRIAMRSLLTNKRRNIITVAAIVLTAILFTTLFTITLSINASYETSIFRQLGGSNHGTFKELTDEQVDILKENRLIRSYGERRVAGICAEAPFTKQSAEISYMDDTCAKWSFIKLDAGHMPQAYNEVIMDTEALRLLGKEPVLGTEIDLSFNINGLTDPGAKVTDTFVLVGYWKFDPISPAHFINVSREYVDSFNEKITAQGYKPVRTDLNVMFSSSLNVDSKMDRVEEECGFTPIDAGSDNYVRYGVNPGYTMSGLSEGITMESLIPILAFVLLVVFTGYLIIYNVFQISVASDIRFYGLLKTIGTTKKQLKRVIRDQALLLCTFSIPLGLLLGYGLGAVLTPAVLKTSTISMNSFTVSTSPVIFIGAAIFEILTVLISVSRPGRMAGKVSPVEALRYTEGTEIRKKKRTTRGAKVTRMAFANMERNKKKTLLVFVSLALSLVILNVVNLFVGGFDREKWVDSGTCVDFVVGNVSYFKFQGSELGYMSDEEIEYIKENVTGTGGCGYDVTGIPLVEVGDKVYDSYMARFADDMVVEDEPVDGRRYMPCVAEGLDECLVDKLVVFEGDVSLLNDPSGKYVAIMTDQESYNSRTQDDSLPEIGDRISFGTADGTEVIDKTIGKVAEDLTDMPLDNLVSRYTGLDLNEYTVCAYVGVPIGIGPRRGTFAHDLIFGRDTLKEAVGDKMVPVFYAFDTPSDEEEAKAESFISSYCEGSFGTFEYESKAVKRAEFEEFKRMFSLLGGVLCIIIGSVGVLNFINTVLAGIISRKNELAVMQAIGMTGKQVKKMLMTEGIIYTVGSGVIALVISVAFTPLVNSIVENMFWFYSGHFSVMPFAYVMPVIAVLGLLVPLLAYGKLSRASIVERIREIG